MTSSASNNGDLPRQVAAALDILCQNTSAESALGVAVSGGSDSTALLVLAADWARTRGMRIEAASVDHGLRPEARDEAEAVGRLCAGFGVPHTILTWEKTEDRSLARPVGQAEAREARHALLAGWARERAIPVLALGHTRDDRIETFLMRARQGSGWRGLAGPLPSGPSPAWPEGRGLRLIRPLLAFGREELRETLRARNLGWAEDPSNASRRFERVRMRDLAGQLDPGSLVKTLRVMDGLAAMRAAALAEARRGLDGIEPGGGAATFRLEALDSLGREARERLIEALIMAAGGLAAPPRRDVLARAVASFFGPGAKAGSITLGEAWLRSDKTVLTISQAPPRRGGPAGTGPAWDRAAALLADPRLAALAVRGDFTES